MGREIVILVNPRAGWGGLLGASGSDGLVLPNLARGPAHRAMVMFLKSLERVSGKSLDSLPLAAAPGVLGEHAVLEARGVSPHVLFQSPPQPGSGALLEESRRFLRRECRGDRLLVFSGGDGTAFESARAWECGAPLMGVPGGSKMYSSVFALSPHAAARGAWSFLQGEADVEEGEVLLVDEESLARGEWVVVEHLVVPTVGRVNVVRQSSKEAYSGPVEEVEVLLEYLLEELEERTPIVLGPGGLLTRLAQGLGWGAKAFAGFAAGFVGGKPLCLSCSSSEIYRFILSNGKRVRIILSVLGRSGFLLGRATRALTPSSLQLAGGVDSLLVVSPPSKLAGITSLKVESSYQGPLGGVRFLRILASPGEYWVKKVEYV